MLERRQGFRGRVYFGGRIVFNDRRSTMECIIRNISKTGAQIEFAHCGAIAEQMDLMIPCIGTAFFATMMWRREKECGLSLERTTHTDETKTLDFALRQRAVDRANRPLRRQTEGLRGFS